MHFLSKDFVSSIFNNFINVKLIFIFSRNQSNMLSHRKKDHPESYVKPAYMRADVTS